MCDLNLPAAAIKINDENEKDILKPGLNIRPILDTNQVTGILKSLYDINAESVEELKSYDDRNYLVRKESNEIYILKILNALDSKRTDIVNAQNQLMIYLSKNGINCPKPIPNVNGELLALESFNDTNFVVRLFEYIPGKILHQVDLTDILLQQCGEYIAQIDVALEGFHNDALMNRRTIWMLQSVPQLRQFLHFIDNEERKELVTEIIESFDEVLSKVNDFEKQIIHGDYNEQNIIINKSNKADDDHYKVTAIIDFGDVSYSPLLFEVGIALTYMILQAQSLESGAQFLKGYKSLKSIRAEERPYLKYCVAARIAQSLILGAYTNSVDQSNEYVLVTQENGWRMIGTLWRERFNDVDELWGI